MTAIEKVLKKAQRKKEYSTIMPSGLTYFVISRASAKAIMEEDYPGKPVPRPGYGVDLRDTIYKAEYSGDVYDRKGHWLLSNRGGKFELQFMYA